MALPNLQNKTGIPLQNKRKNLQKCGRRKQKQEKGRDETVYYKKGCAELDKDGRETRCFESHSKHVHPISRIDKAGTFPYEDENSGLQYSLGQEKSSYWSLSERNVEAKANSNKVNQTFTMSKRPIS